MAYSKDLQYNNQQSPYVGVAEPPSPPPQYSSLFQDNGSEQPVYPALQPSAPVVQQPTSPPPEVATSDGRHPPGWQQLLSSTNHLFILPDEEASACFGVRDFIIKNRFNQTLCYAREDDEGGLCCGVQSRYRPFEMRLFDTDDTQIIHIHRGSPSIFTWNRPSETIEVSAPPGNIIGTIEPRWRFLNTDRININCNGETVLNIECPHHVGCCGEAEFLITSVDGETELGKFCRIRGQLLRELIGRNYFKFEVTFPVHLDVHQKALILGACFLIKCLYFENST